MRFDTPAWRTTFTSPLFWCRYFFVDDRFANLPDDHDTPSDIIELNLSPAPSLFINLDGGATLYVSEIVPTTTTTQLGWEDNCHGHPHVFRWPEAWNIARTAGSNSQLDFGNALLLLSLFSPITNADRNEVVPLLRSALQHNSIPYFAADAIIDSCSITDDDFGWLRVGERYSCSGDAAASLRLAENDSFPHDLLQSVLVHTSR
ncbi:hypothetical protein [Stieleria varia]|uniref:Uncharacterized protein n=1 Tax=Stieleria varia TaxID=2528005 RepID=A0A5C6AS34_9BACT|nr:hypothetical protein [Stieleria varia]TWU02311.1 hypothetical protein Pla52n_33610 [Stieleria varia]